MKIFICAVATALVLAAGSGLRMDAQAAEETPAAEVAAPAYCPPDTTAISPECAAQICTSVSNSATLDVVEQARIGRDVAVLIRDFGATDAASAAVIEACIAGGPNGVFVAFNGSEVAQVGESVPASEQ